jgi:hypothetical protein
LEPVRDLARRWAAVWVLLGGPVLVLAVLRLRPSLDLQGFTPDIHLAVVSIIAGFALVAAVAAVTTAVRSRQPNVIWLGLGCIAVGTFMLGHGLTTPGVLGRPVNLWVGRLPYAAMVSLALALAAAGRPPTWRPNRVVGRRPLAWTIGITVPIVALVAVVVADPTALAGTTPLRWEENALDVLSAGTILLLVLTVRTHWRRWHLGHEIVQFAIVLAAVACVAAVVAFEHGIFGHLSWWDYHGYLLAGFGGAVYVVFRRRRDERTLTEVLETAFVDDPFDHIVSGYPEALRSLVRAVEVKDAYTHGHSERTARLAVELGIALDLQPDQLRVVARGAYLHDVGKIGIPDHVLNKRGALTDEERAVIQTHPELGCELASSAPSLAEALPVIRHHHERFDGTGYPGHLAGADIPLEARVVAVADVWDALTSDRAYRKGWAPADALAHIHAGAGTHFDERVVRALVRVVGRWGIEQAGCEGEAEVAWDAAASCHELDDQRLGVEA